MLLSLSPPPLTHATVLVALLLAAGCSQNPYLAAPGGAAWNVPQNTAVSQAESRISELSRRVQLLDDNNRQLHTQLAQSEQQAQVYRDESELLRRQLAETSQRMEATAMAAREAQSQVRGLTASSQVRGGATIQANTNLTHIASQLQQAGLAVQQDGQDVRIVLQSDQLFQPGSAQLQPQAALQLDPIVGHLRTSCGRQRISIEGYTDDAPIYGGAVATSHQLTSAQAAAVLDMLTRRGGMPPQQLYTIAHGANSPRQPNNTPAGRAANRRIELVIHPETF